MESREALAAWMERALAYEEQDPKGSQMWTNAVARMGKANVVEVFYLQGALSLPGGVDLRRRPWARDPELKAALRAAREADAALSRLLYLELWGDR